MSELTPLDDEDLRAMCDPTGDWGGTEWGDAILRLLDERDAWRDQVVVIRGQQRAALERADEAEAALRRARDACARPSGVCLVKHWD